MKKSLISLMLTSAFLTGCAINQSTVSINKDTLYNDVAYLASDDLKGRKNYSTELETAAEYIANRYEQIGLIPMAGQDSYKVQFPLYQITPSSTDVVLNGKAVDKKDLFVISSLPSLLWNQSSKVNVTNIGPDDDFRKVFSSANHQGGDHLFLIDPSHEKSFGRYKAYFQRGTTKSELNNQGNIAAVITTESKVNQFEVSATNEINKHTLTNVVGVLPGRSKVKEKIIFSAHYDHLGTKGEEVYNGADDDASGTGAVINLAEYYQQKGDNERSLMFVAFTAEEIGLYGSANFSKLLNPDDVTAMLNLEMIGKPSKFGPGRIWMTGADKSNLIELLNDNLAEENKIQPNPYTKHNLFYRSDNATLAKLGVPAHSFSTVQMDTDKHYHSSSDDISTLDFDSMHKVVQNLAKAAYPLISGDITPDRVKPLPVKPQGKIY